MQVIIAEKPSVAREIAAIVGATQRRDGFMEGNDYTVTWALGHLVGLAMPQDYGIVGYRAENLPIVPQEFILQPRRIKEGKEYKPDPGAVRQLALIGELFSKAERLIVATDAGREGELIFRYIYSYLGCRTPFVRLWISSLTDSAIRHGLESLRPGEEYDNLYYSAKARSEADWLVGINSSQALAIAAGRGAWSLGRVQTPTLAIVCERYLANKSFTPKPYFQLSILTEKEEREFTLISERRYDSKQEADTLHTSVTGSGVMEVQKVERREVSEQPPLLYDLTSLQKEANSRHGFSADKTLSTAQALYEKKLITYPRTGSRYISEDVADEIPALITNLARYPFFAESAGGIDTGNLNRRSVNGKKVTDHHALLPTENLPATLAEDERKIYEMVAGRMLEAFSGVCIKEHTLLTAQCGSERFSAKGSVIVTPGWRSIFGVGSDPDAEEGKALLPSVAEGDRLPILSCEVLAKETKPRPVHTEASLLAAMESAGRDLDDEAEREAMKDAGIGTPATRASIIETLLSREYITRENKSLVPTEKGLTVYRIVKDKKIADVRMTGEWELALSKIASGEMEERTFHQGIEVYTGQITKELLSVSVELPQQAGAVCPRCGKGIVFFEKVAKCQNRDCALTVFRTVAKKVLTDAQLVALFTKGRTGVIRGFRKADGGTFDASVTLGADFKTVFDFSSVKPKVTGKGKSAK